MGGSFVSGCGFSLCSLLIPISTGEDGARAVQRYHPASSNPPYPPRAQALRLTSSLRQFTSRPPPVHLPCIVPSPLLRESAHRHIAPTVPWGLAMTTKSATDANSVTGQSSGQTNDTRRAWLWWFLTLVAASQLYFVRELVAAFALFAIVFAAIVFVVATLYMLTKVSELALSRLAELRQRAMNIAAVQSEQRKAA